MHCMWRNNGVQISTIALRVVLGARADGEGNGMPHADELLFDKRLGLGDWPPRVFAGDHCPGGERARRKQVVRLVEAGRIGEGCNAELVADDARALRAQANDLWWRAQPGEHQRRTAMLTTCSSGYTQTGKAHTNIY